MAAAAATPAAEARGIRGLPRPSLVRRQTKGWEQLAGGCTAGDSRSCFPWPCSGSPRAQTPVFPMSSKQHATTTAKPKEGLQNVVRQSEEPAASFESRCCCETTWVQEVSGTSGASAVEQY